MHHLRGRAAEAEKRSRAWVMEKHEEVLGPFSAAVMRRYSGPISAAVMRRHIKNGTIPVL
jgi:hypothetical protein